MISASTRSGAKIGMHTFGPSAPLKDLMKKFGFTPERLIETARQQLAQVREQNQRLRMNPPKQLETCRYSPWFDSLASRLIAQRVLHNIWVYEQEEGALQ
jgi:ribosomal protein L15